MSYVAIKSTAIYHPEDRVTLEEMIEEFRGQGKEIERLLEAIGRKDRYLDKSGTQTPITMAIEASRKALAQSGITGQDLDMICFSTATPEYLVPPNAAFVHKALNGKHEAMVYDINAACVGMVVAIEQATRYLQSHPSMKYALVVGSEQMNRYGAETDELVKSIFGDAACAVLLEKTEEKAGVIDSIFYTNTEQIGGMAFPKSGLSRMYADQDTAGNMLHADPDYDPLKLAPVAAENIQRLLVKNQFTKADISRYFLSQANYRSLPMFAEMLHEEMDKFVFIGFEYAYTGTTSPFLALHTAIERGELQRGDLFILWSIGAGDVTCAVLCRY
ncbi:beta-ketoacyl-ACP synthase [Paenibacillus sp. CAA11]|uniref:ketoacyl-ACP synthase III n=1 Tax=Paenibacillus sp. CAA11 TaxID=1532905 RepID=UPI000D36B0E5|nr:ketoacyl-ACP synthase III [Paenibacillus sp. CAA11]AWB43473.1 beta-ketoacyl-ACP synthase [Paenibacillus sp. CAA11]